jgi:hypothetical protein
MAGAVAAVQRVESVLMFRRATTAIFRNSGGRARLGDTTGGEQLAVAADCEAVEGVGELGVLGDVTQHRKQPRRGPRRLRLPDHASDLLLSFGLGRAHGAAGEVTLRSGRGGAGEFTIDERDQGIRIQMSRPESLQPP